MFRVTGHRSINAVIKGAKHSRTGHYTNVGIARQRVLSLFQPRLVLLILQPSTQVGLLVTQNDPLTLLSGYLGCGQARGATAHNQNITV